MPEKKTNNKLNSTQKTKHDEIILTRQQRECDGGDGNDGGSGDGNKKTMSLFTHQIDKK